MTAKQPFLPLFFGDFMASTAEWEGEEQSLYLLLLGYQWTLGSLPSDTRKLCRLAKWDAEAFARYWPTVSTKFQEKDGRLLNPTLEGHRAKAEEISRKRAASGKAGAANRWQRDSNCHDEQMANAKTLQCHPNQTIDKKKKEEEGASAPFVDGLDPKAWEAWVAYRKAIGKSLNPKTFPLAQKQMAALGKAQMSAVEHSIANNYRGLFAPSENGKAPKGDRFANAI
jgi:uncharacterized protein YdaU (DUF1376 family)